MDADSEIWLAYPVVALHVTKAGGELRMVPQDSATGTPAVTLTSRGLLGFEEYGLNWSTIQWRKKVNYIPHLAYIYIYNSNMHFIFIWTLTGYSN